MDKDDKELNRVAKAARRAGGCCGYASDSPGCPRSFMHAQARSFRARAAPGCGRAVCWNNTPLRWYKAQRHGPGRRCCQSVSTSPPPPNATPVYSPINHSHALKSLSHSQHVSLCLPDCCRRRVYSHGPCRWVRCHLLSIAHRTPVTNLLLRLTEPMAAAAALCL